MYPNPRMRLTWHSRLPAGSMPIMFFLERLAGRQTQRYVAACAIELIFGCSEPRVEILIHPVRAADDVTGLKLIVARNAGRQVDSKDLRLRIHSTNVTFDLGRDVEEEDCVHMTASGIL